MSCIGVMGFDRYLFSPGWMPEADPSVLLVEDDLAIAQLYMLKLGLDGYRVHHAADGTTAQLIFDSAQPSVVCVDARLPDGSGLATAGHLVGLGARVILLTNDQDSYEAPPPGVRLALLKARTNPGQLSRAVAGLLESASPARRIAS